MVGDETAVDAAALVRPRHRRRRRASRARGRGRCPAPARSSPTRRGRPSSASVRRGRSCRRTGRRARRRRQPVEERGGPAQLRVREALVRLEARRVEIADEAVPPSGSVTRTAWQIRRSFAHARRETRSSPSQRDCALRNGGGFSTSVHSSTIRSRGETRIAFAWPVKAERSSPWFRSVSAPARSPQSTAAARSAARRDRAHGGHPAPGTEVLERPERNLLRGRARRARRRPRGAPSPRGTRSARAGRRCRGRGSSCGRGAARA